MNILNRFLLFLSVATFCHSSFIQAEIFWVTTQWTPLSCIGNCPQLVQQAFLRLPGVTQVNVNPIQGQAFINWPLGQSFSFPALYAAMSFVGLAMDEIRISVRGTISYNGRYAYLTSLGDGTAFLLLGPVVPNPREFVDTTSPDNRPLPPGTLAQLLEAAQAGLPVTITGPLFQPERSPPLPLMIVTERIKVDQPLPQGPVGQPVPPNRLQRGF